MGFKSTMAEDDTWIRRSNNHYEYIVRYVDDLLLASTEPEQIIKQLKDTHNLKLKGTSQIKYHMGCDFSGISTTLYV